MCKCIERLFCMMMIATIAFMYIAFGSGGDKFRKIGEKSDGILQKTTEKLADSADDLKKKKDTVVTAINHWRGKKEKDTEESLKNLKELKKEGIFEK